MTNANFNRQFLLTDFRLLDAKGFLDFVRSPEYAAYVLLRRHIWRSKEKHHLGLHTEYHKRKKLTAAIERNILAEKLGVKPKQISEYMSNLGDKNWEIVRRKRTARASIYTLGEWVDVKGDGSLKVEWFYLDGKFGISKEDLVPKDPEPEKPDGGEKEHQMFATDRHQTSVENGHPSNKNIEVGNIPNKTKTVRTGIHPVRQLPDLDQPEERTQYVADLIMEKMGDKQSARFYKLIAAKVPEHIIRINLAEIEKDGGANHPPSTFTKRMKDYANKKL